jgi:hypothetical protein
MPTLADGGRERRMFRLALLLATCGMALAQTGVEPIRLDDRNPHYFRYRGKTTVLITSGEHYGAVMNEDFDYAKYLDSLRRDGLNYTRLFGGSYIEVPGRSFGIRHNTLAPAPGRLLLPWARSQEPGYAGGGNRFDLERWEKAYFTRLRSFLRSALEREIFVEITLFSSQYGEAQWALSAFKAENNVNRTSAVDWKRINTLDNGNLLDHQERYARKLVREANPFPNVIFEIQNEPWSDHGVLGDVINPYLTAPGRDQYPNSVDVADADSLAWQKRVAEWIRAEEAGLPNKHLIAQNYCNFRFPVDSVIPGVGIINFHYAYPEAVTLNYGLGKALAYDETGFLGQADEAYRRQAWNFILAGGSAFDGLDYSFTPGHEDGTESGANGPGGGSLALRKQLGVLRRLLDALPLAEMTPDANTVAHGAGVKVRMLSKPGSVYAAYLDGKGSARITLELPAGSYRGEWVDPESGAMTEIAEFRSDGGGTKLDTPRFTAGLGLRLWRR